MGYHWEQTFRKRMSDFRSLRSPKDDEVAVSIKIGVTSGCFHREHSPQAYGLIDAHLAEMQLETNHLVFEEHESGPELLVFIVLGTAGITLAKSVIDLVIAIIKARSEGIKRGDDRRDSLKLKIRRTLNDGSFEEEIALEIDCHDMVIKDEIEAALKASAEKLLIKNRKRS